MISIVAAAAVALTLTIPSLNPGPKSQPTCNIKTVSYKFVGAPGVAFKYDGDSYVLPPAGSIELIAAKKATTARFVDHDIPLDLFPIDEFGTRTIELSSKTDTN